MFWFIAANNRAIVQRSWALNAVAASARGPEKAEEAARSQYGPEFTYDECLEQWPATGFLGWLSVTSASLTVLIVSALLLFAPPVSCYSGHLIITCSPYGIVPMAIQTNCDPAWRGPLRGVRILLRYNASVQADAGLTLER